MGKKSSKTKTTSVQNYSYDPVASKALADIAGRQQDIAEDQWDMYKEYFQDYEIEAAKANRDLLPYITESTRQVIETSMPIREALSKEAMVSPEELGRKRADQAQADVMQGVKLGEQSQRREASRYGINPNSTAFSRGMTDRSIDTARMVSGARTKATTDAELESFNKKASVLGMQPLSGGTGVGVQYGNGADPYSRAVTSYSGAASSYTPLATRVLGTSGTSTSTTPSGGFGGFLGNLVGMGVGAMTGGMGTSLGTGLATKLLGG